MRTQCLPSISGQPGPPMPCIRHSHVIGKLWWKWMTGQNEDSICNHQNWFDILHGRPSVFNQERLAVKYIATTVPEQHYGALIFISKNTRPSMELLIQVCNRAIPCWARCARLQHGTTELFHRKNKCGNPPQSVSLSSLFLSRNVQNNFAANNRVLKT